MLDKAYFDPTKSLKEQILNKWQKGRGGRQKAKREGGERERGLKKRREEWKEKRR